jgi:acyl carrier protein
LEIMDRALSDRVTRTVIAAIAKIKRREPETITMDTTLEELQIDSLDGLNLFFDLEEIFDITIPDIQARSMRTVRQIVEGLEQVLAGKDASGSPAQT